MTKILNVAGYRFVRLTELDAWRAHLHAEADARALKGTVLIAAEGLNLSLAGLPASLLDFLSVLTSHREFAGLAVHETVSRKVPFERLRVKVKHEIIRMNQPTVRPATGRAPAVDAATLARWLDTGADDAGRELILLDTRNGFEVDAGRFRGALDWRLDKFSDFPATFEQKRGALDGKTVVAYCTGGIRCEKAALLMTAAGQAPVWQLDGGLLGYFRSVGARHFEGACVVFDGRGMLADTLEPVTPV